MDSTLCLCPVAGVSGTVERSGAMKTWRFGKTPVSPVGLALAMLVVASSAMAAKPPTVDTAGNNLSFPVIWAEGVAKVLPGTPGMTPILLGEWWYQWGTNGIDLM